VIFRYSVLLVMHWPPRREQQEADRIKLGSAWADIGLVFAARRRRGLAWDLLVGAPHGWYVSHLAVLVSPGSLTWSCGRRLPHDC
jgi:hypothetical protein